MPNIYHGSLLRFLAEGFVAAVRSPRRQFRTWFGNASARGSAEAAGHLELIWNHVRTGDRQSATAYALDVAAAARQAKDAQMLWWVSDVLAGLEQYEMQARCLYESRRLRQTVEKDWNGNNVDGALLADFRHRTPAWPLRHSRFIPLAAARARTYSILCEPRLVPLFKRTFPQLEILSGKDEASAKFAAADAVVNHQDLAHFFGTSADALATSFVRLQPDPKLTADFRRRYGGGGGRPLIGISWGSSNQAKDAPSFKDWATVFQGVPATFVSLQYGRIDAAIKKLRRWAGSSLIYDESVDQLVDLDLFAAQIASLDAIVSTSSTVVHLAGMLGVPCVVILDDNLPSWPMFGTRTPWYPQAVLVHRRWRAWPDVMKDAVQELKSILAAKDGQRAASA